MPAASVSSPHGSCGPAGRASAANLSRACDATRAAPFLQPTIDALVDAVVILNACRQIVAANRCLLEALGAPLEQVLGRRPGELLGCVHADSGADGCGTSEACRACGALQAVLECQQTQQQVVREARLRVRRPVAEAFDFLVAASPVLVDGEPYTICVLKDIGPEKRLAVLSRLFFHDVLNTAGGIQGYVQLLREHFPPQADEARELADLQDLADQLVDEILLQREFVAAEAGELELHVTAVTPERLLGRLRTLYERHPLGRERTIRLGAVWQGGMLTDERLLARVLSNMLKNALEATWPGGEVTLGCAAEGGQVRFTVHNPGAMPPEVQRQVFQRSFSTKGEAGRGVGTHSMKLFGERYLGGRVSFESSEPAGTTFVLELPKVRF